MRLPNLLEHDTIQEASQQAQYWVQLLKTGCSVVSILFTYPFFNQLFVYCVAYEHTDQ